MACQGFQWWGIPLWGGKEKGKVPNINGSSSNSHGYGVSIRETESVKFPLKKGVSSPRKFKKKWNSREERKIDREHDVVLVPKDGVGLSESDSEDSDWSIGWLEPHGHDFLSDDETDDSFAVLVPCYRNDRRGIVQGPNSHLLNAIQSLTNDRRGIVQGPNSHLLNAIQSLTNEHFTEGKNMMDQWLSSLQQF